MQNSKILNSISPEQEIALLSELNEKMLAELAATRQVLIEANFEPIMREIVHFNRNGAVTAQPLSFHIKALVDWNKQTQDARDAFRIELESLGYTPDQLKTLYGEHVAKQTGERKTNETAKS